MHSIKIIQPNGQQYYYEKGEKGVENIEDMQEYGGDGYAVNFSDGNRLEFKGSYCFMAKFKMSKAGTQGTGK